MKKIGRNEPCPCGSGKKYKKCCLNTSKSPIGGTFIYTDLDNLSNQVVDLIQDKKFDEAEAIRVSKEAKGKDKDKGKKKDDESADAVKAKEAAA